MVVGSKGIRRNKGAKLKKKRKKKVLSRGIFFFFCKLVKKTRYLVSIVGVVDPWEPRVARGDTGQGRHRTRSRARPSVSVLASPISGSRKADFTHDMPCATFREVCHLS